MDPLGCIAGTHGFGYCDGPMTNRSRSAPPLTPSVEASELRATSAGTASFARRFLPSFAADYFRPSTFDLTLSSIGIGTYLGHSTDEADDAYVASISHAVECGVNMIDTAINYRNQRSECAVGTAIQRLLASGAVTRPELVVCSKGGYIPLSGAPPATRVEYRAYVQRQFIDEQILRPEEIVAGGHSLAPRFLRYCLAKSRQNLGLRSVDVYYLHNPEQQLGSVTRDELTQRIRGAFAMLEESVTRGEIGVYGVATWDGLRVPGDSRSYLSLESMASIARQLAGDEHHFRAVQIPINLAMTEAVRTPTQLLGGRQLTAIEAAGELGMTVVGSATLMQSKLTQGLPDALHAHFPGCSTDAQRAVRFARTVPGVTSVLVGMKQLIHVNENLADGRA